ncbi:MAG TPA: hypothetical protein VGF43_17325 [Dongiaceae bacterium]|jgi:hypothetical protein
MEVLGIIEGITGILRLFFLVLGGAGWLFRRRVRGDAYFLVPLVGGAVVAAFALAFPLAELFLAIGVSNFASCQLKEVCGSNFRYASNSAITTLAFLAAQLLLYVISRKSRWRADTRSERSPDADSSV